MKQEKVDNRCEELEKALYSPLSPFIKWGVYIVLIILALAILVGFNIYTTNTDNTNALCINSLSQDGIVFTEFAINYTHHNIYVGDDIFLIGEDDNSHYLGKVMNVKGDLNQDTILIQTDTLLVLDAPYLLRISHSETIGEIILSYITKRS